MTDTSLNFTEDLDLRQKVLELMYARLKLIEKENLTPLGINIQTGRLKIEL
jgi:hypothetical protein